MKVGFIGLGEQGEPMARQIIDHGYDVVLWARREATLEPFRDTGCRFAASPTEVGAASDLVGICVSTDDDVMAVVLGEHGVLAGMAPGSILVIHSTVHPHTVQKIAGHAAAREVSVVDAPVSGGNKSAKAGNLLVVVGGDAAVYERCLPVFSTYGDPVMHVGPLGSGELAKVVNNTMFVANMQMAYDAVKLGSGLGLDGPQLVEALLHGSGRSYALGRWFGWSHGDTDEPLRAADMLRKDVAIASAVAEEHGATPGMLLDVALRTVGGTKAPST